MARTGRCVQSPLGNGNRRSVIPALAAVVLVCGWMDHRHRVAGWAGARREAKNRILTKIFLFEFFIYLFLFKLFIYLIKLFFLFLFKLFI
jgi:hypothetical protein